MLPREERAERTLEKTGFFLYRGVQLFSPVPSWGRGEEDFSFPETGELSIEGASGEGATVELGEVLSLPGSYPEALKRESRHGAPG